MTSHTALLDRVRKLLAKAEAEGVTPAEAEALTAKAAELMAKYGIDRALLAADRPETDQPASRIIDVPNPWARVKAHLLCGLGAAMRCQCILLSGSGPGARIHVFGYASDLDAPTCCTPRCSSRCRTGWPPPRCRSGAAARGPGGAAGCSASPPR